MLKLADSVVCASWLKDAIYHCDSRAPRTTKSSIFTSEADANAKGYGENFRPSTLTAEDRVSADTQTISDAQKELKQNRYAQTFDRISQPDSTLSACPGRVPRSVEINGKVGLRRNTIACHGLDVYFQSHSCP